jgi:hypothetical protein
MSMAFDKCSILRMTHRENTFIKTSSERGLQISHLNVVRLRGPVGGEIAILIVSKIL